jgi:hypothetical protein
VGDACVAGRIGSWTTGLTHTAGAGNDRLLVFMVGYENATDVAISTVKYGGQSLTRINGAAVGSTVARVELWYLKEAGIVAATNTTFVITYGGTAPTELSYGAGDVPETSTRRTPVVASAVNSANGASPNPLTAAVSVTADGMAVAGSLCGNASTFHLEQRVVGRRRPKPGLERKLVGRPRRGRERHGHRERDEHQPESRGHRGGVAGGPHRPERGPASARISAGVERPRLPIGRSPIRKGPIAIRTSFNTLASSASTMRRT